MIYKRIIKFAIFFIILDIFISISYFTKLYLEKKGYLLMADKFHFTRFFIFPFLKTGLEKLPKEIKFVGFSDRIGSKTIYTADSILGWRLTKNVAEMKTPHMTYKPSIRITNSQGFASSGEYNYVYNIKKEKNVFRVIVLGSSPIFGDGAESIKDNLTAKIKEELKKEINTKKLELINAGVGGYHSGLQLMYLTTKMRFYEPDLVIVYGGLDEVENSRTNKKINEDLYYTNEHQKININYNRQYNLIGSTKIFFDGILITTKQLLNGSSIYYFSQRVFKFLNQNFKKSEKRKTKKIDNKYIDSYMSLFYKKNLETIINIAKINNFKIAIFSQPTKKLVDNNDFYYKYQMNFYNKARLMLNDLALEYNESQKVCISSEYLGNFKNTSLRYWEDNAHLLGVGNEIVAKKISLILKDCKFFN